MPKHVMLDLETFSTAKNATIISIGAVRFDPWDRTAEFDRFHVGVDPALLHANVRKLFDIDPSTMRWWLDEDRAAARQAWIALEKTDLGSALDGFATWFGENKDVPVWGNASTFDNVLMRTSYELLGLPCPWGYRSERCYRTLKQLAPHAHKPAQVGVTHDALADATWQALHLQEIMIELNIMPDAPTPAPATHTLVAEPGNLGVTVGDG